MNYLDPQVLSKIKTLELRTKLIVEGFLLGIHRSPYHGFSSEFTEHRPYQPGDELKRIDWKVYARSLKFYTKQFEEETNLKAYIILDASASMSYFSKSSPGKISKYEYACWVASSLAWLLIQQKDAVALTIFDEKINLYIPPLSTKTHLAHLIKILESSKTGSKTKLLSALDEVLVKIKKPGLVIILSDLLVTETEAIQAIKNISAKKNEVIIFHILDTAEIEFPFKNPFMLKDVENQDEIPITPELKSTYKEEVQKFIGRYKQSFSSQEGIEYLLLKTSEPLDRALSFYLAKRENKIKKT